MRRRLAMAVVATTLALAGCSGDSDPGTDADADADGGDAGDVVEVPGVVLDGDAAALSPDGSRIAVPCDGSTCIWTTADGVLADIWEGGSAVAWNPAADVLVTSGTDSEAVTLERLDPATGTLSSPVRAFARPDEQDATASPFADLEFSPRGDSLAGVDAEGMVRIWTVAATGELDPEATIWAGLSPSAVAFSPDGETLAVASTAGPTTLRDVATGEVAARLGDDPQGDVAWSPDGTSIATASFELDDDATTKVWDAVSGEASATLARPGYRLAFVGDDTLALTEKDESGVVLWAWADDDVRTLDGSSDMPRAVLVAPDGSRVYAVSPSDGVLAWDIGGGEPTTFEKPEE